MSTRSPEKRAKRARRRRRGDRRGVALVMTLGAITILTVFLTQLQEETSAELASAFGERDALKAEYYARSAVNLSRLLIAVEPQIRKSLPLPGLKQIPIWMFADMVLGPFNDASGGMSFNGMINADPSTAKNMGLGGGRFELTIVDEESKLNLNTASKSDSFSRQKVARQLVSLMSAPQYAPLFEQPDLDNQRSDQFAICGAIVDWTDADLDMYGCADAFTQTATAGVGGTEDNFYQLIGLGYQRKDAAFDSLGELRLVRGMGDDFWATFIDPDPGDPAKRIATVWGLDRVNVNTAAPEALLGIICSDPALQMDVQGPCLNPMQQMSFLAAVKMARSLLGGIPIFTPKSFVSAMQGQGGELAMIGQLFELLPMKFLAPRQVQNQLTNKSQMFSIYAEGVVTSNRMSMSPTSLASQYDANGNPVVSYDADGNPVAPSGGSSNRRTPRVRIHAVVDFRTATDLGTPMMLGGDPGGTAAAGNPNTGANSAAAAAAAAAMGAMGGNALDYDKMINANPAGKIVYWRVE